MDEITLKGEMMEKRKVLFVAHHLTVGGVQKSLISALNAVDYERNDVTLYLRKNRTDLLPYINEQVHVVINDDQTHYYRKPKAVVLQAAMVFNRLLKRSASFNEYEKRLGSYIQNAEMDYEQQKYFSDKHFDVAVAYVQGYVTGFTAKCVSANKKITFYQSSTDESHEVHESAFPNYDVFVVEHEDIKKSLCEWYPEIVKPEKVTVIDNYVDKDFLYKQAEELMLPKDSNKITVCTCGRMAEVKGFDLAIKAAAILKEKGLRFIWYMVGDGPERSRVEELLHQYQLEEYVVLTGMQKNPYPYMMNADIYVQPSREEALSVAMLESQVLAAPMVSTRTVGGMTMVRDGENGVLADMSEDGLATAVERLMKDDELRNRIHQNLKMMDYSREQERYRKDWKNLLGE